MSKTAVKNKNEKINPKLKGTVRHMLTIFIVQFLIMLLTCAVLYMTDTDVYSNYPIIAVVCGVGCFISAYYSGYKYRKNGMIIGIIYNAPFFAILLPVSLILNSFSFDIRLIITLLVILITSAIGGIVAVNTKIKRRK